MQIVTHRKFRPKMAFDPRQGRKRDRIPGIITHVELADILRFCAKWPISLEVNLPCPSESIEIIDKRTTHENLDGFVHIGELDALLQDFVLINVEVKLRDAPQQSGCDLCNFRAFPGGFHEFLSLLI